MDQKLGGHHVFAYHNPVNLPFAQEYQILMFVYLWFFVPLENSDSFGDVTITSERLQIFIYTRT